MKRTLVKFSLSGIDGNSNRFLPSWGNIPNTHLGNLIKATLGNLWYNSGPNRGSNQHRTLKNTINLPGSSGLESALGLKPLALRTSLLSPGYALSLIGSQPKLSYSALRSKRLIRPAMWEACVQHDKMASNGWSLNGIDGITISHHT